MGSARGRRGRAPRLPQVSQSLVESAAQKIGDDLRRFQVEGAGGTKNIGQPFDMDRSENCGGAAADVSEQSMGAPYGKGHRVDSEARKRRHDSLAVIWSITTWQKILNDRLSCPQSQSD